MKKPSKGQQSILNEMRKGDKLFCAVYTKSIWLVSRYFTDHEETTKIRNDTFDILVRHGWIRESGKVERNRQYYTVVGQDRVGV